jgi:hypothetical protein
MTPDPIGILTLAVERGAAWHRTLSLDAASNVDLELLKWLYQSGCFWPYSGIVLRVITPASAIPRNAQQRMAALRWLQQLPPP